MIVNNSYFTIDECHPRKKYWNHFIGIDPMTKDEIHMLYSKIVVPFNGLKRICKVRLVLFYRPSRFNIKHNYMFNYILIRKVSVYTSNNKRLQRTNNIRNICYIAIIILGNLHTKASIENHHPRVHQTFISIVYSV